MSREQAIEVMAAAIHSVKIDGDMSKNAARAAYDALQAAGFAVVPEKPTDSMIITGAEDSAYYVDWSDDLTYKDSDMAESIYCAMIAAHQSGEGAK